MSSVPPRTHPDLSTLKTVQVHRTPSLGPQEEPAYRERARLEVSGGRVPRPPPGPMAARRAHTPPGAAWATASRLPQLQKVLTAAFTAAQEPSQHRALPVRGQRDAEPLWKGTTRSKRHRNVCFVIIIRKWNRFFGNSPEF